MAHQKRKNPRAPVKVQALQTRLESFTWDGLSRPTLIALFSAGLHHLIRRDPPLAERWLAMIERADYLEHRGTMLTLGLRGDARARKLHGELKAFEQLNLGPGMPKVPENWEQIEADVLFLEPRLTEMKARTPQHAPDEWWAAQCRALCRAWLPSAFPLEARDLHNFRFAMTRSARAAAIVLVARARRRDPKQLAQNLYRWKRGRRAPS